MIAVYTVACEQCLDLDNEKTFIIFILLYVIINTSKRPWEIFHSPRSLFLLLQTGKV